MARVHHSAAALEQEAQKLVWVGAASCIAVVSCLNMKHQQQSITGNTHGKPGFLPSFFEEVEGGSETPKRLSCSFCLESHDA